MLPPSLLLKGAFPALGECEHRGRWRHLPASAGVSAGPGGDRPVAGVLRRNDREFTLARLREVRSLLDVAEQFGDGVEARPITSREGYARWAEWYDEPGNQLLEIEGPIVREILDVLEPGVALDAVCGT